MTATCRHVSVLNASLQWQASAAKMCASAPLPAVAEDINRGQLELPERVLQDLQAEASVMSRMRHPKRVPGSGRTLQRHFWWQSPPVGSHLHFPRPLPPSARSIVQFMGLVSLPPALITEYCSRGSLYDCLAAAREQPAAAAQLTWQRRLAMAIDAGAGLLHLHCRNIIHRDGALPGWCSGGQLLPGAKLFCAAQG